jgi:hypothetical protein
MTMPKKLRGRTLEDLPITRLDSADCKSVAYFYKTMLSCFNDFPPSADSRITAEAHNYLTGFFVRMEAFFLVRADKIDGSKQSWKKSHTKTY